MKIINSKINFFSLFCCVLACGFWMVIVAQRYYFFINGTTRDAALTAQSLWSILHGNFFSSVLGTDFFAEHTHFLSFLLAPLYWLLPDPMLLQYLKIIAFFSGAYIFFLILKKHLHPLIALGAMIAYIFAPANIAMLLSVFNYEPFAIPLIFLIFKALDDDHFNLYIISCIALLLLEEQMPLVVMMFGLFSLIFKKENKFKWGIVPLLMGLLIFIFAVFILTPYVRHDLSITQSFFWLRYAQFGKTPQDILLYLFTHPISILARCLSGQNTKWYDALFGSWGWLSFFSPHILLVALPLFLKTLLSNRSYEHLVTSFYYASTFTPFIFLAAWNTLNHVRGKWRRVIHILALGLMLVQAYIVVPKWPLLPPRISNAALIKERFIEMIPSDASVLAAWSTLAPLANRKNLYTVDSYLRGSYYVSRQKFKLSQDTDYLLLDFANEWLLAKNRKKYTPKITALNFNDNWRLKESIEDVALYVRNPSGQKADRLIERQFNPFPVKNIGPNTFDNTISLKGLTFPHIFLQKYRIFPVTMYWECLQKTNAYYNILINITSLNGKSYYAKRRPIGSTIYPTYFWKKDEYIKESYFYLLPHLPKGKYDMRMAVYNTVTKKWTGRIICGFEVA